MSRKECERCGQTCKRRRVTCCACGRAIGLWYDCGCSEKWTEVGPSRYFCDKPNADCDARRDELVRRLDELSPTFLKKMKKLNGRWP